MAGSRPFQGHRKIMPIAGFQESGSIFPPAFLVKIRGQEKACLVLQDRENAHDEWKPPGIQTRQVPTYGFVRYGQKTAVGATTAFDGSLIAKGAIPLVRAGGHIAFPTRLPAFKSLWIDVLPSFEQRPKEPNFRLGR